MDIWTPESISIIAMTFLLAGLIKGIVGLGLPTVSLSLLAVTIGLKSGMALMLFPSLFTNLWQAAVGGRFERILARLWTLILPACIGIWFGAGVLARADALLVSAFFGILLCLYSAISLTMPQIPPPGRAEGWLSPLVGSITGLTMGFTGSFIMPGVLYLQALGLSKDELVQAMGITFGSCLIALTISLAGHSLLPQELIIASLAAVVPSFVGMAVGQKIRKTLSEDRFRQALFFALLIIGVYLIVRAALVGL